MRIPALSIALCYIPLLFALPLPLDPLHVERARGLVASTGKAAIGTQWSNGPGIIIGIYDSEPHPVDAVIAVLEKRGVVSAVAKVISKGFTAVIDLIKNKIAADKTKRNDLVKTILDKLTENNKNMNYLVINSALKYEVHFDGQQGVDWGENDTVVFKPRFKIGKTIRYRVYWGKTGYVINYGDGGFLNWGYFGHTEQDPKNHNHVRFLSPA